VRSGCLQLPITTDDCQVSPNEPNPLFGRRRPWEGRDYARQGRPHVSMRSPHEHSDMRDRPRQESARSANRPKRSELIEWISRRGNPLRRLRMTTARARPTRRRPRSLNCELAYRQPIRLGGRNPLLTRRRRVSATSCSSSFPESRHARLQSHGHLDVAALYSSVHLERVNQGYFACADNRVQGFFLGPRRRRTGLFHFLFMPKRCPAVPLRQRTRGHVVFWARNSIRSGQRAGGWGGFPGVAGGCAHGGSRREAAARALVRA
jgi:hypothetical protein